MISVVFITCNRKDELSEAIISCLDKISEPFEIVIVDNSSSDGTKVKVVELSEKYNFELNYLYNVTNLGVAQARNIGYKIAKGDVLFFLDDDAKVVSDGKSISDVANFMRAHNEYPIVATEIFNVPKNYYQHGVFPISLPKEPKG